MKKEVGKKRKPILFLLIMVAAIFVVSLILLKFNKEQKIEQEKVDSASLIQRANKNYNDKNYLESIKLYKKIIDIEPENYAAYIGLGHTYLRLRLYDHALNTFEKTKRLNYFDFRTFYGLGLTYYAQEDYKNAYQYLKIAYDLNPRDKYTVIYLVNTYNTLGLYAEAINLSNIELEKDPSKDYFYRKIAFAYILKNDFVNAIDNANRAIGLNSNSAHNHLALAIARLNLGDTDLALTEFNSALILLKSNSIYEGLAETYYIKGDMKNYEINSNMANKYLKDSLSLSLFGFALLQNKKHDKAIELFNMAISDNPNYYLPYVGLAKVYMSLGQKDKAVENLEKAVERNNLDAGSKALLQSLRYQLFTTSNK